MSDLDGVDVPRRNGELAFDAPWQARIFALTAALVETRFDGGWEPFRTRLIAAIAADEARPYWESWAAALDDLLITTQLVSAGDLDSLDATEP